MYKYSETKIDELYKISGHTRFNWSLCFVARQFYRPLISTFSNSFPSNERCAVSISSLIGDFKYLMEYFKNTENCNTIVSDVPGDSNFWIYAFCMTLHYSFNVQLENQYVRDEFSSFILKICKIEHRLNNPMAFQMIENALN